MGVEVLVIIRLVDTLWIHTDATCLHLHYPYNNNYTKRYLRARYRYLTRLYVQGQKLCKILFTTHHTRIPSPIPHIKKRTQNPQKYRPDFFRALGVSWDYRGGRLGFWWDFGGGGVSLVESVIPFLSSTFGYFLNLQWEVFSLRILCATGSYQYGDVHSSRSDCYHNCRSARAIIFCVRKAYRRWQ